MPCSNPEYANGLRSQLEGLFGLYVAFHLTYNLISIQSTFLVIVPPYC